jgi:hypothetical protein
MKILYSASANAFFDPDIHGDAVPDDAVSIGRFRHRQLLDLQANGARICAAENGRPMAERPLDTIATRRAEAAARVKSEAGARILAIAPLWRQANDNAAIATAALETALGAAEHSDDFIPALERRRRINAVRAASGEIEAAIAGMSAAELEGFDLFNDVHWPAPAGTGGE